MNVIKPNPEQLLLPITTATNNQSELEPNTWSPHSSQTQISNRNAEIYEGQQQQQHLTENNYLQYTKAWNDK